MTGFEAKSPFEAFIMNMISNREIGKVNNIHPEDFLIIMDSIFALFFKQGNLKDKRMGLRSLVDYAGLKIEFSDTLQYPCIKKDPDENYKIIVLPDKNETEELKQFKAHEALKEFDCLEVIETYELCLRIFHTFSDNELIILAREFDPQNRDLYKLEKRFLNRADMKEEK